MSLKNRRLHPQSISCFHCSWNGTHFGLFSFQFTKTLFYKTVFFGTYLFMKFFKTSQMSKYNHLSIKSPLLSSCSFLFNSIKTLKLIKSKNKFTFKTFSLRLNIRPYDKLDKKNCRLQRMQK